MHYWYLKYTDNVSVSKGDENLPVFAFFADEGWLLPPAFIDRMDILYTVAAFSPVTVPGEFVMIVSMKESPSCAVSK